MSVTRCSAHRRHPRSVPPDRARATSAVGSRNIRTRGCRAARCGCAPTHAPPHAPVRSLTRKPSRPRIRVHTRCDPTRPPLLVAHQEKTPSNPRRPVGSRFVFSRGPAVRAGDVLRGVGVQAEARRGRASRGDWMPASTGLHSTAGGHHHLNAVAKRCTQIDPQPIMGCRSCLTLACWIMRGTRRAGARSLMAKKSAISQVHPLNTNCSKGL
jgi:hypothetical protein